MTPSAHPSDSHHHGGTLPDEALTDAVNALGATLKRIYPTRAASLAGPAWTMDPLGEQWLTFGNAVQRFASTLKKSGRTATFTEELVFRVVVGALGDGTQSVDLRKQLRCWTLGVYFGEI